MVRMRDRITPAVAVFAAFAFTAAPVGLDYDFTPETKSAFAKGKGSGKSGGKGGGSKRSSSSSSASANAPDDARSNGNAFGHDKANGNGHNGHDDFDTADHDDANAHGKLASEMGNLNAAHASPTALENASEDSLIGRLADYLERVTEGDLSDDPEGQQEALGAISNKADDEGLVSEGVVTEVNDLLGVETE